MAIKFEGHVFHLTTAHTLYQIGVDAFGILYHLWYGAKTDCSMDYLFDYPDVGFSGNPYEAGKLRTYSMDTLPLEYSTAGTGACAGRRIPGGIQHAAQTDTAARAAGGCALSCAGTGEALHRQRAHGRRDSFTAHER